MANKKQKESTDISLTRTTRSLYFFIAFYALSIIVFDSGNLITREAVVDRWTLATFVFVVNTVVWLLAIQQGKKTSLNYMLTIVLSLAFIVFAGYNTYWERGMASTSTIFYLIPVLIAATLRHRHTLLGIAALAAVIYGFATVKYFNDFFNEGFRVQLWGSILLYMGTIFASAWLIMIIAGLRHDSE